MYMYLKRIKLSEICTFADIGNRFILWASMYNIIKEKTVWTLCRFMDQKYYASNNIRKSVCARYTPMYVHTNRYMCVEFLLTVISWWKHFWLHLLISMSLRFFFSKHKDSHNTSYIKEMSELNDTAYMKMSSSWGTCNKGYLPYLFSCLYYYLSWSWPYAISLEKS